MKIGINKKIGYFTIFFCAIFSLIQTRFGAEVYNNGSQKIAVVGDSYAGHFSINNGFDLYEYYIFPVGTIYDQLNKDKFESAIDADNRYILFATGVNDQALKTDLKVFETELRRYAEEITKRNKFLFFHTYMNYPKIDQSAGKYSTTDYDDIYKKLADEYENVLYIDMSSFQNSRYDYGDGLHYNSFFYVTLSSKLLFYINQVERSYFKSEKALLSDAKLKQIAVAGDEAAEGFCNFEREKSYEIYDFSNPNFMLLQNREGISQAIRQGSQSVLIATGKYDYDMQVRVSDYEDLLRDCLNEACIFNKNVFIYSSLDYADTRALPISSAQYDLAIERVANEYPNACYVNLRSFSKEVPQIYDTLYEFMDIMIKRIY